MKLLKHFILLFLSLNSLILSSQIVNIESKRQSDEKGWSGLTEFSFDYNKSTQIDWELSNTTYLQWDNNKFSILLLNEINFDRGGGIDFSNDGYQHLRLSKILNKKYAIETYLQNQYDPVRNIKQRQLAGLGLRKKLKDFGSLGLTTFYEKELLTNNLEIKDVRLSVSIQLKFIFDKSISISTTNYYQPVVENFEDYKISNETIFLISLSEKIALSNIFSFSFDTDPAINIPKLIYNFQNGFIYSF